MRTQDFMKLLAFVALLTVTIIIDGVTPTSEGGDEGESAEPDKGSPSSHESNKKDFSKTNLELDVVELLGTRWIMDQNKLIIVYHSLEIVDAVLFDKGQLGLRAEFYLQQRWTAEGVRFPEGLFKKDDPPNFFITAKETALKHMWHPQSYISSSRESSKLTPAKTKVYIYPNKTIVYRARMYAFVACSTNFEWYPMDKQACALTFEGYTFHSELVHYVWENKNRMKPISLKIERPLQYDLESYELSNGSMPRGGIGLKFPFASVKFTFERKLGNSIIQVYIPTTLIVWLSWLSFWLGLDAVPGRISMLITSMLSLVTLHVGNKNILPPVHYTTMMDVWMVTCMLFVFTSVLELIIVKYLFWKYQKNHMPMKERKIQQELEEHKKFENWLKIVQLNMSQPSLAVISSTTTPNPEEEEQEPKKEKVEIQDRGDRKIRVRELDEDWSKDGFDDDPSRDYDYDAEAQTRHHPQNQSQCRCRCVLSLSHCKCLLEKDVWVRMDMISRTAFPAAFTIFNCVYWPYLYMACEQQGSVENYAHNIKNKF